MCEYHAEFVGRQSSEKQFRERVSLVGVGWTPEGETRSIPPDTELLRETGKFKRLSTSDYRRGNSQMASLDQDHTVVEAELGPGGRGLPRALGFQEEEIGIQGE